MTDLNLGLLLVNGTLEGPYRKPHPITLSLWRRLLRAWRNK